MSPNGLGQNITLIKMTFKECNSKRYTAHRRLTCWPLLPPTGHWRNYHPEAYLHPRLGPTNNISSFISDFFYWQWKIPSQHSAVTRGFSSAFFCPCSSFRNFHDALHYSRVTSLYFSKDNNLTHKKKNTLQKCNT